MKKLNFKNLVKRYELLKVVSLITAIILFVTINPVFSNPIWNNLFSSTQVIPSVKLNVNYDTTKYYIKGVPSAIDVNVSGSETEVKNIADQEETLVAEINLNGYQPGNYEIQSDMVTYNVQKGGATVKPTQDTFNINVQELVSTDKSVSINYANGEDLKQGVLLGNSELTPNSISVKGGNEDVSSVSVVMGLADLTKLDLSSQSGTSDIDVPLIAYDTKGNKVNDVTLSPSTIKVKQNFTVKSMKLPVVYEYINNSTSMYVSQICLESQTNCSKTTVEEVEVYGNEEQINKLSSITYQVDLSSVDSAGGSVTGRPVLDSGVYILNSNEHKYNVTFEKGKTVKISDVSISIVDLDAQFDVVANDAKNAKVDVSITGAESVIDAITKDDITVYADLSEYNQAGKYTVPLLVKKNKNVDYSLSKDTIDLEIKLKE